MIKLVMGLLASSIFATMAWAENYHCDFVPTGSSQIFPRSVDFSFAPGGEVAKVSDAVVRKNYGEFIVAKVTADNPKRFSLQWRLDAVKVDAAVAAYINAPNMAYSLSFYKFDNTARLRGDMLWPARINDVEAPGRCKLVKK